MTGVVTGVDDLILTTVLGNGTIEWPEFVSLMERQKKRGNCEADFQEAFKAFDLNNTGYLGPKEIRTVMSMLGIHLTKTEVGC